MKTPEFSTTLNRIFLSAITASILFGGSQAFGQVNGAGPSDSSLFDDVINVPEDLPVFDAGIVGDVAGETTQLNLSNGGAINAFSLSIRSGVESNISGGTVGRLFASAGSELNVTGGIFSFLETTRDSLTNISGGTFSGDFTTAAGSDVTISGGVFRDGVELRSTSDVDLVGGEFSLNGAAYDGATISLAEGDTFSGVFQNGTAFIFSDVVGDSLSGINLTTTAVPLPTAGNFVVDSQDTTGVPLSLRTGQTLEVNDGGSFTRIFESVGGTINVTGGLLGNVTTSQSSIDVSGGEINNISVLNNGNLDATGSDTLVESVTANSSQFDFRDVTVNGIDASNSVLNFSGTTRVFGEFRVTNNSVLNISDDVTLGTIFSTGSVYLIQDSEVNVSGGTSSLGAVNNTAINLTGGEINGLSAFRSQISMEGGTLQGRAIDSDITLLGGSITPGFSVIGGVLDILGGRAQAGLNLRSFGTVNLLDGRIGRDARIDTGGAVNISGGTIGNNFMVGRLSTNVIAASQPGGMVDISGGVIGDNFTVVLDGTANISGGTFGDDFRVLEGGNVNLFGSNFDLNGLSLDDELCSGEAFTLRDRNGTLSGLLADGSPFSFALNNFHPDATVTLNFVPEPILQLVDGNIIIMMTRMPDEITVTQDSNQLEVNVNNACETFEFAEINRIVIFGFGGIDLIQIDARVETTIHGGGGDDIIFGGKLSAEIFGGPGRDLIVGGPASDFLDGGRGNDVVEGLAGDDQLFGRAARDVLSGGPGNDELFGGLGGDILSGGNGNDLLVGNAGADTLNGNGGDDELIGFGGPDEMLGGPGDDDLSGGAGFDTMDGGGGIDAALDKGEVEIGIENS